MNLNLSPRHEEKSESNGCDQSFARPAKVEFFPESRPENSGKTYKVARKLLLIIGILVFCFTGQAFAQNTIQDKLRTDIVTVTAGQYRAENFWLLRWQDDTTMQIEVSATSPVEVMSRDNFVSLFSTNATLLLIMAFAYEDLDTPHFARIDELIGEPDMTINFVMTRNGMQVQVITFEGQENTTMRWEEIFDM